MVSHNEHNSPVFFPLYNDIIFQPSEQTNNNGCTNTLLNKLFNVSHMLIRQHSPNLIYKTLHQYKNFFSHAPCHQSTNN